MKLSKIAANLTICSMDYKDKKFEVRSKQWQALCEKYRKRGELDSSDCAFSEVYHKLFVKPKIFRSKQRKWKTSYLMRDIDKTISKSTDQNNIVNDNLNKANGKVNSNFANVSFTNIKDESSFKTVGEIFYKSTSSAAEKVPKVLLKKGIERFAKSFTEYSPTKVAARENIIFSKPIAKERQANVYSQNSLGDLIQLIEVDLNSRLKDMLIYRSECKILESDNYSYWHSCTKNEMKRLQKYITKAELKEYMRHCDKVDINLKLCDKVVNVIKHNLKNLLIKRELVRNDREEYLKYCNKVYVEWQRLSTYVPVNYRILYASSIINLIKERRSEMSSFQGQMSADYVREIQSELESMDPRCITL